MNRYTEELTFGIVTNRRPVIFKLVVTAIMKELTLEVLIDGVVCRVSLILGLDALVLIEAIGRVPCRSWHRAWRRTHYLVRSDVIRQLCPLAAIVELKAVLLALSSELELELLVLLLNFVDVYILVVI